MKDSQIEAGQTPYKDGSPYAGRGLGIGNQCDPCVAPGPPPAPKRLFRDRQTGAFSTTIDEAARQREYGAAQSKEVQVDIYEQTGSATIVTERKVVVDKQPCDPLRTLADPWRNRP